MKQPYEDRNINLDFRLALIMDRLTCNRTLLAMPTVLPLCLALTVVAQAQRFYFYCNFFFLFNNNGSPPAIKQSAAALITLIVH